MATRTDCWQVALERVTGMPRAVCDSISGYRPGSWTWPHRALSQLVRNGFEVRLIGAFDYWAFALNGFEYLKKRYGGRVAREQRKMTDLKRAQSDAEVFARLCEKLPDLHVNRPARPEDVVALRARGYGVIAGIGAGHFVVVDDADPFNVTFSDAGGEAVCNWERFSSMWMQPTPGDSACVGIKPRR